MKIRYLLFHFVFFIRELNSKNQKFPQRLFIFIIVSILASGNLSAQISDITRLPPQNIGTIYEESSPVTISDNDILIFFLTKNSTPGLKVIDTLYSTRSTDGGKTWQGKKFIFEVDRGYQQNNCLTALRTNSGRILLAFIDYVENKTTLIHSDDEGETWSEALLMSGFGPNFKLSTIFNKIIISWQFHHKESYDDGETWSQTIDNLDRAPNSYVSLDENNALSIYFKYNQNFRGFYERISTDGGQLWSEAINILDPGDYDITYSVIKINSNEIYIIYKNRDSSIIWDNSDIYFIKSTNQGESWSNPVRYTTYAGIDDNVNGTCLTNKPFITFSSTRFTNKPQISYALIEETIEKFRPPFISDCKTFPSSTGQKSWTFNCRVNDEQEINKVILEPEIGSQIMLFDDGRHNDIDSADNIFGNNIILDYIPLSDNCIMDVNKIHLPLGSTGVIAEVENSFNIDAIITAEDNDLQKISYNESITFNYFYGQPQYDESSFLFSGGFALSGYTNGKLWSNGVVSVALFKDYIPGKFGTPWNDSINKIFVVKANEVPFGYSWQQWRKAVDLGAEFYDGDGDGIYNPVDKNWNGTWDKNEDMPMLIGNETAWCLYNDGMPANQRMWHIEPQGIEVRQTVFASNIYDLENVIFFRYTILNTGAISNNLDSVYLGIFKDPDLGDLRHNLIGCDTLLNSDFVYNKEPDLYYGNNSPSFFTTILQGPVVPSAPGDTANKNAGKMYGSSRYSGFINLNMTSHILSLPPYFWEQFDPLSIRYNLMGKVSTGDNIDPCNLTFSEVHGGINCNEINPVFWMSGDPVSDVGWILTMQMDFRNMSGIGPFQLIKDKPQDIIIAYVLGRGTDPINSITVARENVRRAIQEYQSNFASMTYTPPVPTNPVADYKLYQNYPNPFNPVTTIRYQLPQDGFITVEIFDILGQRVKTLLNKFQKADRYEVEFNGSGLASGIYIYRIKVNDFIASKKMVLLK